MKANFPFTKILGSEAKVAVLKELVLTSGRSVAHDLAEKCGVSMPQVGRVLREFCGLGLVLSYEGTIPATYEFFRRHPLFEKLENLFRTDPRVEQLEASYESLREHGLQVYPKYETKIRLPLEEALAGGVELAVHDSTLLSLLPAFIARHRNLDLEKLRDSAAMRPGLRRRIGMLLDYTGTLVGDDRLRRVSRARFRVKPWPQKDPDRRKIVPFSGYFRKGLDRYVKENTATAAMEWGYYLGNSDKDFRARIAEMNR